MFARIELKLFTLDAFKFASIFFFVGSDKLKTMFSLVFKTPFNELTSSNVNPDFSSILKETLNKFLITFLTSIKSC